MVTAGERADFIAKNRLFKFLTIYLFYSLYLSVLYSAQLQRLNYHNAIERSTEMTVLPPGKWGIIAACHWSSGT